MTLRAQYSYGVQLGARPKAAPEYIGATNRASRRRAWLAELDRLIADLSRQPEDLAAQRERVLDLLADLSVDGGAGSVYGGSVLSSLKRRNQSVNRTLITWTLLLDGLATKGFSV